MGIFKRLKSLQDEPLVGVLTGAELTDMKISLIAGRGHEKHTEGGDFREAARRAVRQGLMMAQNVLLEPVMRIRLEVPSDGIGRALNDTQQMGGKVVIDEGQFLECSKDNAVTRSQT